MTNHNRVYIILLNWNSWQDTINCVNSILDSDYKEYSIVICDNHSTNDSVLQIKKWIKSKDSIKDDFVEYYEDSNDLLLSTNNEYKIILINNNQNNGFASGNNVGIKFAVSQENCKYIWILNNDTLITKDTLSVLVNYSNLNKNALIGATLYDFDKTTIQAYAGGYINKVFGYCRHIKDKKKIEKLDYIVGASIFLQNQEIIRSHLLPENYFLYWEEVDWCVTLNKLGFKMAFCEDAIVYHKEGASHGKSELYYYLLIRNALIFMKKHYKAFLLPALLFNIVRMFTFLIKRKIKFINLYRRIKNDFVTS